MSAESTLTTIPTNTSFLQPNKFSFTIPTLPFLTYFCQNVQIPAVSTSPVVVDTPFSNTFRHGDKLQYESLIVTIIVDEDLRSWEETYNWLVALTFPDRFDQYIRFKDKNKSPYHDAILTVNNNNHQPNMRIKFTECHPSAMTGVSLSTTADASTVITCDITFRYDGFDIERL